MNFERTKKGEKGERVVFNDSSYIDFYKNDTKKQPKFAIKYSSDAYKQINIGTVRKEDIKLSIKMIKNFKKVCPSELEFLNRTHDSLVNPKSHSINYLDDDQFEDLLDYINDHY